MKLKSTLLIAAVAFGLQSNAQTWVSDSVEMGAGYANDVFYNLKTGSKKTQVANDWDLAFQMNKFGDPMFNATVRANHIKRKVEVYSLHMAVNATTFAAVSASDTNGKTSRTMQLMNVDTSWGEGAFYQNRDKTDLFDYGWGEYQGAPNHDLQGDSLYLVKVNGTPYKIWIQQYISLGDTVGYKFRIAALDNSMDNSVFVKRKNYPDRIFVYYDIASNSFVNREPSQYDWDIVFTQYAKIDPAGGPMMGGPSPIAFTGVLQNIRVKIAKLKTTQPDTAKYNNLSTYSAQTNTIGDDWKFPVGSPPTGYALDTVTYFVRSSNVQEYIQLKFTRFDGASGPNTGKILFDRRSVGTTTVADVKNNVSSYAIVPNPAVGDASFAADVKEAVKGARLLVTDITGKVMLNSVVDLQEGMNAFRINTANFAAGTYVISLSNGSWKVADRLIVQH